jgi:hypothetical protein
MESATASRASAAMADRHWRQARDAHPAGAAYAEALAGYFETDLLQDDGGAPYVVRTLLWSSRLEACEKFIKPLAEKITASASAAEGAAVSILAARGLTEDDLKRREELVRECW